jgi:hypothetical protein
MFCLAWSCNLSPVNSRPLCHMEQRSHSGHASLEADSDLRAHSGAAIHDHSLAKPWMCTTKAIESSCPAAPPGQLGVRRNRYRPRRTHLVSCKWQSGVSPEAVYVTFLWNHWCERVTLFSVRSVGRGRKPERTLRIPPHRARAEAVNHTDIRGGIHESPAGVP